MAVDLKALTSRKVAGIPVIYLVLGIAVVALYGAVKLKAAPATEEPPADGGNPDEMAGDTPDTSQPVFSATPTLTQPSGPATSVSSTPGPDTDTAWSRRAIDWLRQNGYTIDVATSAITKYLNGETLSYAEGQARDKAVQQFGLPPETVPSGGGTDPKPTTTSTTPNYNGPASKQGTPPTTHTVRGTSDDSYEELARLYYGYSGHGTGVLISSYNHNIRPPFAKGTRIIIPKLIEPKFYRATSATRTAPDIARKNGTNLERIINLNPSTRFPVAVGVQVRVR